MPNDLMEIVGYYADYYSAGVASTSGPTGQVVSDASPSANGGLSVVQATGDLAAAIAAYKDGRKADFGAALAALGLDTGNAVETIKDAVNLTNSLVTAGFGAASACMSLLTAIKSAKDANEKVAMLAESTEKVLPGLIHKATSGDQEAADLALMILYLKRKNKNLRAGAIAKSTSSGIQATLTVVACAVFTAVTPLTIAAGAVGLAYFAACTGFRLQRGSNSSLLYADFENAVRAVDAGNPYGATGLTRVEYKHSADEGTKFAAHFTLKQMGFKYENAANVIISQKGVALERQMCAWAAMTHPLRHKLTGTTWGDYMRTRIAYHVMTRKALAARGGYHSVYDCISQLIANCVDYADDSKPPQWSENPATWAELVGKDVVAFSAKMPVTST